MKQKRIIACNWKLYIGSRAQAKEVFLAARKATDKVKGVTVISCPPYLYVQDLAKLADGRKNLFVGAQNIFYENSGAYTGEVSPAALIDSGATHAIIGHSERRAAGETDADINKKLKAAMKAGLTGILCVGERQRDDHGAYLGFLRNQLLAALAAVPAIDLGKLIIAYEPVWAIGKSQAEAMTAHDLHQVAIFIRKTLAEGYGADAAFAVPVLYGGSVGTSNVAELLQAGVQGLLIGRASTNPVEIADIIRVAGEVL